MNEQELPNNHGIPIPKVKEGIELIAGRRYPIILCECGNQNQQRFDKAQFVQLIDDPNRDWQKKNIRVTHVACRDCKTSINKIDFDLKARKLVEESEKKHEESQHKKSLTKSS